MAFFRKNLKKSTPQQEADFKERMADVPLLDKLIMIGTAFVVIVLPCFLVITGMTVLVMWILGLM